MFQAEEQVLEVLHDQASKGQTIVLPELEAKKRYPSLVIASLDANRKEKPRGQITARALFDGTKRPGSEQETASPGPGTRADRCRFEEIYEWRKQQEVRRRSR